MIYQILRKLKSIEANKLISRHIKLEVYEYMYFKTFCALGYLMVWSVFIINFVKMKA